MLATIKNIFGPDERYEGVYKINLYLLRLLFILMFLVLGRTVWTHILTFNGAWNPDDAVAWSVWAAFSVLSVIGIVRPLKMLPLVLLEIFYKVLWLILVAYPLWSTNQLVGSPAEPRTYTFLWVVLPILAMPWKYAFETYIYKPRKNAGSAPQLSNKLAPQKIRLLSECRSLLLMAILAPIAYLNTFQSLVKFDDAALTAQNIMNALGAFRLCILLLSFVMVLDIVVAWALYCARSRA